MADKPRALDSPILDGYTSGADDIIKRLTEASDEARAAHAWGDALSLLASAHAIMISVYQSASSREIADIENDKLDQAQLDTTDEEDKDTQDDNLDDLG